MTLSSSKAAPLPGQEIDVFAFVFAFEAVQYRANLLRGLVEVEAGGDQLVSLLGSGHEALPPGGHPIRDLLDGLGVVVVVGEQRFGPLSDVNRGSVGFLNENKKII